MNNVLIMLLIIGLVITFTMSKNEESNEQD